MIDHRHSHSHSIQFAPCLFLFVVSSFIDSKFYDELAAGSEKKMYRQADTHRQTDRHTHTHSRTQTCVLSISVERTIQCDSIN